MKRRTFLSALTAGLASAKDRLIIDTHLEVWTLDPKFPFGHPERPDAKPSIAAPIENQVEQMKDFGLKYAVLINPRYFGWDNSYISYSLHKYPKLFVAHGLINPEDPNVTERLRYWVKEHGFQGMRFSPIYHPKSTWLNSKDHYPLWKEAEKLGRRVQLLHPPAPDADARRYGRALSRREDRHRPSRQAGPEVSRPLARVPQDVPAEEIPASLGERFRAVRVVLTKEYPYRDTIPFFKATYEEFGGKQLIWGTGYPRPRWELPMDKELEFVDKYLDFYTKEDRELLLGKERAANLALPEAIKPMRTYILFGALLSLSAFAAEKKVITPAGARPPVGSIQSRNHGRRLSLCLRPRSREN